MGWDRWDHMPQTATTTKAPVVLITCMIFSPELFIILVNMPNVALLVLFYVTFQQIQLQVIKSQDQQTGTDVNELTGS